MNRTKIRLSEKEWELVSNTEWILTKNTIQKKAIGLFADLQEAQRAFVETRFLHLQTAAPKISKGENYLGLPFVILDYPRFYSQQQFMAIRTFFWWGHYFTLSLHANRMYTEKIMAQLQKNQPLLAQHNFCLSTHEEEWQHAFTNETYTPLAHLSEQELTQCLTGKPFIKLAKKYPLESWLQLQEIVAPDYSVLVKLLEN